MDSSTTENNIEELLAILRSQNPTQYYTLIKMHLSFATDLATDQCDGSFDHSGGNSKWNLSPLMKKLVRGSHQNQSNSNKFLSISVVHQLFKLIAFLNKEENITQEGLFRKAGSMTRQTELKAALQGGQTLNLSSRVYSAHDCASVLKSFLADLPEPLLQESQYHVHCRIAEMCGKNRSFEQQSVIYTRQIKSLRLIFLLLPSVNYEILKELLHLLYSVASYQEVNKMSSLNLGTMFAPHILCPRKMSPSDLQFLSGSMSTAIAFIIENAPHLFEVPPELEIDVKEYFRSQKNLERQLSKRSLEEAATKTSFSFLDRELTARANDADVTEMALAELYAYVQSLPNSARKTKLIGQFNEASGQGTPKYTQSVQKKAEFKVKSFGDSIKKHLFSRSVKKSKTKDQMVKGLNIKRSNSEDILRSVSNYCSPEFEQRRGVEIKTKSCENLLTPKASSSVSSSDFLPDFGQSPQLLESPMTPPGTTIEDCSFGNVFSFSGIKDVCSTPVTTSEALLYSSIEKPSLKETPVCKFATFGKNRASADPSIPKMSADIPQNSTPLSSVAEPGDKNSPISRAIKRLSGQQNVIMTPRSRCPLIINSTTSLSSVAIQEENASQDHNENSVIASPGSDISMKNCGEELNIVASVSHDSSRSSNELPLAETVQPVEENGSSLLGGFFRHLSTTSLMKIATKLHSSSNLVLRDQEVLIENPENPLDESLSNVFKEYLLNRSILTDNPVDLSSQYATPHTDGACVKEPSSEQYYSASPVKITDDSIVELKEIVNSPQPFSDSLLLCLDGIIPISESSSKRLLTTSEDIHDSSPPKRNKASDSEESATEEVFHTPTDQVKFIGTDNNHSNILNENTPNRLFSCSPESRSLSLLKNRNGTPLPNKEKENVKESKDAHTNVLFETDL